MQRGSDDQSVRRRRRAVAAVADQAVSSVGNAALTILAARALSGQDFGQYALVLGVYQLLVVVGQSLVGEPLLVLSGSADAASDRRPVRGGIGASLALGLVATAVLLPVGVLTGVSSFWALGVLLPGLLVQDALRYVAFDRRWPSVALASDSAWVFLQLLATVVVLTSVRPTAAALLLAWGVPVYGAVLVAAVPLRTGPSLRQVPGWLRATRHLGGRFLVESGVSNGVFQVSLLITGGLAGVTQAGRLRLVQTLFGPIHIMVSGTRAYGLPEMSRTVAVGASVRPLALRVSAVLGCAAAGWTCALLLVPDGLARDVIGPSWPELTALIALLGLHKTLESAGVGPYLVHRARLLASWTLRVRLGASVVATVGTVGFSWFWGAAGAAAAAVLGSTVAVSLWWWRYLRADRPAGGNEQRSAGPLPRATGKQSILLLSAIESDSV